MKKLVKSIIRKCFDTAPGLSSKALDVFRFFRLRREAAEYGGRGVELEGESPSIVFYTHNRCASMMVNRRILDLMEGTPYRRIDYQRFVHPWPDERREQFRWDEEGHREKRRFKERMFYYGAFRYFVRVPDLESYRTIVVLRDPRDVITSRYFSEAFAHVALDKQFHSHTARVREMDIDTFVKTFAKDVDQHYRDYMENHDKLKAGVVWRYEDLIDDFEGFLSDVNGKCELGNSPERVAEIAASESFVVDREDKFSHKRSVRSGAYLKKLKPETVEFVDELFKEILEFYGWEKKPSE